MKASDIATLMPALVKGVQEQIARSLAEVYDRLGKVEATVRDLPDIIDTETLVARTLAMLPKPEPAPVNEKMIVELVEMAVSQIEPPKGEPGKDGADGKDGAPGKDGKDGHDGIGLASALTDANGALVLTMTDGRIVPVGNVNGKDGADGKDGRDGLGLEDLTVEDHPSATVFRFARGDVFREFVVPKASLADFYRDVWETGAYRRGEVVTLGGSMWLARKDTEARPGTNEEWTLMVKHGRHGRDGKDFVPRAKEPTKL